MNIYIHFFHLSLQSKSKLYNARLFFARFVNLQKHKCSGKTAFQHFCYLSGIDFVCVPWLMTFRRAELLPQPEHGSFQDRP